MEEGGQCLLTIRVNCCYGKAIHIFFLILVFSSFKYELLVCFPLATIIHGGELSDYRELVECSGFAASCPLLPFLLTRIPKEESVLLEDPH